MYELTTTSIDSLIVGMYLGDGGTEGHRHRPKSSLKITHSIKQLEYFLYKRDLLEQITSKEIKVHYQHVNTGTLVQLTARGQQIRPWARKFYPDGYKIFTREILEHLTPWGLAVWFMDDGSTSYKYQRNKITSVETTLNTYRSVSESQLVIDYFKERWDLRWQLNPHKQYVNQKTGIRLRMGRHETNKLFDIIEPYIIPSMAYKIKR